MTILEYYQKTYDSLIEKRRKFPLTKDKNDPNYVYCETHHILPKCMGGSNDEANLVNLTAREHFIAHKLLFKIYEKSNDKNAYMRMGIALGRLITGNKKFINNISISSKEYEKVKKMIIDFKKDWKHISNKEETRQKMSISRKNYIKNMSQEEKNRLSKLSSEIQRKFSKEKKDKINEKKRKTLIEHNMLEKLSKSSKNHRWVKNPLTHESKCIQKEEVEEYLKNGWIRGYYKGKLKHPKKITTIWICNDETQENKQLKIGFPIPIGWRKGRLISWIQKYRYNIIKRKEINNVRNNVSQS